MNNKLFIALLFLALFAFVYLFIPEANDSNFDVRYEDSIYEGANFSFEYSNELVLNEEGGRVKLFHDIPFENQGACDMAPEPEIQDRLTDFEVVIYVSYNVDPLPYIDGEVEYGKLDGKFAYMGAEGCGISIYHFPFGEEQTLVIERSSIQALSGVANKEIERQALEVPGAISLEKNETLFKQIVSSIR